MPDQKLQRKKLLILAHGFISSFGGNSWQFIVVKACGGGSTHLGDQEAESRARMYPQNTISSNSLLWRGLYTSQNSVSSQECDPVRDIPDTDPNSSGGFRYVSMGIIMTGNEKQSLNPRVSGPGLNTDIQIQQQRSHCDLCRNHFVKMVEVHERNLFQRNLKASS